MGTITGRVTDGTSPMADFVVRVEASTPSGWIAVSTAHTASDGLYTVTGLAPGAYRVTFEDPTGRIPPEVYDDASPASATLVQVASGVTVGGIDATLELPELPATGPTSPPSTAGTAGPTAAGPTPATANLPKIVAITAGQYHYCFLGDDGSVWCWGGNGFGELGLGAAAGTSTQTPGRVEGIPDRVRQVVAYGVETCALTESGGAWCWGDNRSGELGDGTKEARSAPTPGASAQFGGRLVRPVRRSDAHVRSPGGWVWRVLGRQLGRPAGRRDHGGTARAGHGVRDEGEARRAGPDDGRDLRCDGPGRGPLLGAALVGSRGQDGGRIGPSRGSHDATRPRGRGEVVDRRE